MAAPTPASFVMQGSFAPSSFAPSSFALPLDQASFATTDFSVDGFFKGRDRGLSLNSAVRAASPSRHRGGSLASNVSESETAFSKFKEQSRSNFTFDDPTPVPLVKPVNAAPLEGMLDKQSGNSLSELDPEHTPSPNGHSVSSPTTTHGPSYATATSVLVVDPLSRKLCIPRASIRDTLATSRPGIPSLCLLYTSNKCRQGNQCHQIHADPQVVLRLRAEAKSMSTCCAEHGDVHNHLCRPEWSSRSVEVNGIVIPHAQLAYTGALAKLYNDNPTIERLAVPLQLICRLHGAERCRYSDDCRFIHICRRVLRQHFSGAVEDLVPQLELRHQQTAGSSRHGKTTQSPNTTGVERTPPATTPMSPSTSPHSFVGPITIPSPTSATVMVGSQQFQQQQQRMRPASANTTPIMAFPAPNSRPTSTTPTWMQIGNPTQPIFIAHPGAQGPLPGTPTVLNPSLPLSAGPSYVLVPIQQYNAILASTTPPPTQSSPSPMVMLAATSHDNNSPFQLQSAVRGPQ